MQILVLQQPWRSFPSAHVVLQQTVLAQFVSSVQQAKQLAVAAGLRDHCTASFANLVHLEDVVVLSFEVIVLFADHSEHLHNVQQTNYQATGLLVGYLVQSEMAIAGVDWTVLEKLVGVTSMPEQLELS